MSTSLSACTVLKRSSQSGYTLLEILVSSSIALMCAAIGYPMLGGIQLRHAASVGSSLISSDLLAMRYHAVAEGVHYRMRMEDDSSYLIEKQLRGAWIPVRRRRLEGPVTIESNSSPVFTPIGSVTNMATIYVEAGGMRVRKISLSIMGRVKVERLP